jgi:hypothetical protein
MIFYRVHRLAIFFLASKYIRDVAFVAHISENIIILIYCIYLPFTSINYYHYVDFVACLPIGLFTFSWYRQTRFTCTDRNALSVHRILVGHSTWKKEIYAYITLLLVIFQVF